MDRTPLISALCLVGLQASSLIYPRLYLISRCMHCEGVCFEGIHTFHGSSLQGVVCAYVCRRGEMSSRDRYGVQV